MARTNSNKKGEGSIIRIQGPVIDVFFKDDVPQIFEALEITDKIKKAIIEPRFNPETVRQEARADGFRTMFEDGLDKVQLGQTTIEEVLRVIRE